jgi:rhodanese-related sulfurtransferase
MNHRNRFATWTLAATLSLAGCTWAQPPYPQQRGPQTRQRPQQPGYLPPDDTPPEYPAQRREQPPSPGYDDRGGYPENGPRNPAGSDLDQLAQWERAEMGVRPKSQLHTGPMHGPTPTSIPGGQVITTKGLVTFVQQRMGPVFDVLGGPQMLPGALAVVPAAQPGSFQDENQQRFGAYLRQLTRGRTDVPLVFYCQGPQCWMSYNAALRAINLGYQNVLWYRGGIEAWQRAGQPTMPNPQSQQNPQMEQDPRGGPQQPWPGNPQQPGMRPGPGGQYEDPGFAPGPGQERQPMPNRRPPGYGF